MFNERKRGGKQTRSQRKIIIYMSHYMENTNGFGSKR